MQHKLTARKGESPALAHLRGVVHMIDQAPSQRPLPTLVAQIRAAVVNAMDIIKMPDPVAQALFTAALVYVDSTSEKTYMRNGRQITRVTITDPVGYGYATRRMHQIIRGTAHTE